MQYLVQQTIDFLQKTTQKADFDKKNFENFIKIFYSEAQDYDFANYSAQDLYNAAKLSFEFLANKKTDEFKVRIYNPTLKKDGFESPYTFLDIVNNDMPFLVDSTVAYLDKYGIRVKNSIHPIYSVIRDKNGKLLEISAARNSGQESVIQLHFHKIVSGYNTKMLQENIEKILRNTALIFEDSQAMIQLLQKASLQIDNAKRISDRTKEIQEFLAWIADNNFILLGAVEFDICQIKKGEFSLKEAKNSSFGVFRSADQEFRPQVINSSFEEVGNSVSNPYLIEFVKSRYRSLIHKITNAERIRVQKIAPDGKVIGEFRFIGLFTSAAHHQNVNSIPLIRSIIAKVIADSGYIEGSHNYKDLISVLESYPRDELFQISPEDLLKNATGIVGICGRSQVKFFARKDKFNRFVSCLVFTPRDYSNSELRDKIKNHLSKVYNGEITDSFLQITDSNLIRFHIIICTDKGIPDFDEAEIERQLVKITTVWSDDLFGAMKAKFCDEKHISLFTRYKNAFSVSYINRFDPKRAAIDISRIEECSKTNLVLFNLYKSSDSLPEDISELKIFSPEKELVLSSIMPVLESFGFNVIQEHTYVVSPIKNEMDESSKKVWIHYFHLNLSRMGHKFSEKIKLNFEKTIALIWSEVMVISFLNRLVIVADLNWKQVYMLGAYTRYLYQAGFRYSENYIADILVRYSDLTKLLAKLFEIKFDPFPKIDPKQRQDKIKEIVAQINQDLNQVKDVADDQVIRRFFSVITATLRTNYYQHCRDKKGFKGYISFKFDCKKVPNLPLPLPHTEAFVYSARFEAIHLRGGKVARGGLRWSDRQEDFRTEVLGLMKAQMTKNALIVPVGSKGGFVLKRNLSCMTRDEIQKEAIECYQTFLSGLLDITDNVVDGKIEHPQNVIMHDESDPYLVVAADKGTATFSDIANQISANYHFWLGDAFASGGSFGYDHKKMGITARGAWISVMRHFREMKIDTQSQNFTCIGIGDMAGDVFGNGMLLSRHIKLVAAFNHLHIFLDPNPDTQKSFFERKRLFDLPQSSWTDYSQSLISKGGGVFTRSVKSIKISPEIKKVLAIKEHELSPDDLIKNILKAPVDLLWNGGIGTYVKSCDESEQEVSDRSNDLTRVNGNELRCKVVGEGGNLGFTQKGRIEYALNGGRINTDFIDNSAGVDCSDHEVNIKIALTAALRNKKITFEERNQILESMTEEVANLVLKDNNLQTHAISVAALQGIALIDDQAQFLDKLEKSGLLNRKIEFLPSKKEIDKRQNDRIG
jgi:glutamate dehydrogenase